MKKILSLVIAMIMLMTCAALAESENCTVGYIAVMDPVVTANGAPVLDMTGLAVEIDVALADSHDLATMLLKIMVGENFETSVATGQMQLDKNGMVLGADGLSNLYAMDYADMGMEPLPFDEMQYEPGLEMPNTYMAQRIIDSLSVSEENGVHQLALSREDGEKLVQTYVTTFVEAIGEDPSDLEGIALELTGEGFVKEDGSASIALNGVLTKEGEEETIPVNFSYSLSAEGSTAMSVSLTAEEDALGFSCALDQGVDGAKTYSHGTVSASITADGETYAFDTGIQFGMYTAPMSDWALDGSSAIDIATMNETQMTTLQMGAMGILGNAMTLIQENVPGLAELINSAASGMMG